MPIVVKHCLEKTQTAEDEMIVAAVTYIRIIRIEMLGGFGEKHKNRVQSKTI